MGLLYNYMSIHERILKKLEEGSRGEGRTGRVIKAITKKMHKAVAQKRPHSVMTFADKAGQLQKKRGTRRAFKAVRGDYTRSADDDTRGRHRQGIAGASTTYKAGQKRIIKKQGHDDSPSQKTMDALDKETTRSYARNVGKDPQVLDTPGKVKTMATIRKRPDEVGTKLDSIVKRGAQLYRFKRGLRTKGVNPN